MFRGYQENDKLLKILLRIYLENFTQNVSLISLLDSLMIVRNKVSITCKWLKWGNGGNIRFDLA